MTDYSKKVLKIKERRVRRDKSGKLRLLRELDYRGKEVPLRINTVYDSLIRYSNKIYAMNPINIFFRVMMVQTKDKLLGCIVFEISFKDWLILPDWLLGIYRKKINKKDWPKKWFVNICGVN